MPEKKTEEWICPVCGESIYLTERGCEVVDMVADIAVSCDVCGAKWNEYFSLQYKGYAHKGIDYDADGEEMFSNL